MPVIVPDSRLPEHEYFWILEEVLQKPRAEFLLTPASLTKDQQDKIESAIQARLNGLPLQYIFEYSFFRDRRFHTPKGVLIPRPETEMLVEFAKEFLIQKPSAIRCAELGVGSGVIAISLLVELKNIHFLATDITDIAISTSKKNAQNFHVENRLKINKTALNKMFSCFLPEAPFDLIVCNPPYLAESDEIARDVFHHEPHSALFPQNDNPSIFYEDFLALHAKLLAPYGKAFFEIPHNRAKQILSLFLNQNIPAKLHADLTGRPRILEVGLIHG